MIRYVISASFAFFSLASFAEETLAKPQAPSILAFGDSIMAGYSKNGDLRFGKLDFVSLVGQAVRTRSEYPKFEIWNLAIPGLKTGAIRKAFEKLQIGRQRDSDILLLNGGGNNALPFRKLPLAQVCDERTYEGFVPAITADWVSMTNLLRSRRPASKPTLVLGLYYPPLNQGLSQPCGPNRSVADVFLPFLAAANHRIQELAKRDQLLWLDLMPIMNCPASARHLCEIQAGEPLASYQARLAVLMKAGIFRDPGDNEGGIIQADHVHPNARGHRLISESILQVLGY